MFRGSEVLDQLTLVAHCYPIRDPDCIVLPGDHVLLLHCLFHRFSQVQQVHVARVSLPPDGSNADMWALCHCLWVGDSCAVQHSLVV